MTDVAARDDVSRPESDDAGESDEFSETSGIPHTTLALIAIVLVGAVWAWIPFLRSSLLVDESLTWWMIQDSFSESIRRPYNYQGQSPLYFMFLWGWVQIAGDSELALRIPTIAITLAGIWQMRCLGREVADQRAGDIAAGFYAAMAIATTTQPEAQLWVVARPYSALFLALIVAARFGWRWSMTDSFLHGLATVFFAAVAVYMHPLAIYTVAAFIVWAMPSITARSFAKLTTLAVIGAALLIPLVSQVISLGERQETFSYATTPPIYLVPLHPLRIEVLVGLIVPFAIYQSRRPMAFDKRGLHFALAWTFFAPFGLWAQGVLTGSSVFLFRYYSSATVGLCLLAALFVRRIDGRHSALLAMAGALVAAVVTVGIVPTTGFEAVAERVREEPASSTIIATNSLIELSDVSFIEGESIDYISAHLAYYDVSIDALLPRFLNDASEGYIASVFREASGFDRVVIVEPFREGVPGAYYGTIALEHLGSAGFDRLDEQTTLVKGNYVTVFQRR